MGQITISKWLSGSSPIPFVSCDGQEYQLPKTAAQLRSYLLQSLINYLHVCPELYVLNESLYTGHVGLTAFWPRNSF